MDRLLTPAALAAFIALIAATAPALASVDDGPQMSAPRTLPSSAGFGEPGIASAPDGTLYVTAPGSHSALWRSLDGGATWARVHDSLGSSGDSDVAIDANGVVYVNDLFSNVPVSVSFDQGTTMAYETTSGTSGSNDRQWIAASGDGNVFSVWRDGSTERIAVSHDRAVSWTRHVVSTGVGLQGNIVAADDTTLYIPFSGTGGINLAKSTDAGVTWTKKVVYPSSSSTLFPAVAVDAANNVYVAWIEKDNDLGYNVRVAMSPNGGSTFTAFLTLATGHTSIFPWIVAQDAGHVAVAWYDTILTDGVALPPDAAALASWDIKLAYSSNADLGLAAAWDVQTAVAGFHTGPICTQGTGCFPVANPVYGSRALLDFFELAARPDGGIVIAFSADQAANPANTQTVIKVVRQMGGPDLHG